MKDGSLLTSASRFNEATIYCVAPPPNWPPAPPYIVKLVASWQSGLETPSAFLTVEVAVAACTFSHGRRALGSAVIRGMIAA